MYNPSSLAQALETVPAAEQALLDSLRGPDAAHRITDDQIREIITSSAFKPRYGRDDPKSVYVDADVNTRIFFHPYDHNEITVGITCQLVFSSTTFGSNFQQAWLSVSDGEHVSTRPLSKEAFCQAIATDQFYYYETSLLTEEEYWDSEIADYMLQHNNTKGTEVEFTRDGNIKSYPPTLEQVNRAIQFFSEGEFPPFSNVEYETRMKELDEEKYDYTSTLYDNLRYIFPGEDDDTFYSDTYQEVQKLMRIEPKDSPLLVAANAVVERHVSNRAKFLLEVRQESNGNASSLATEQTADTPILREALQAILEWEATKDEQLRKLERGGRSISENVALLSGKTFTSKLYTNIGGIVETETVSASFATEWRTSDEARKEGAGLYDKDDAPLFLNVPADVMYRSVREAIGEGYKQARMDDAKQYFIDLKDEMIGVIPKFWLDVLGSAWGKRELDRHTKRVFADTSDEVNYDVLSDHHIPHKFFFGHIEYCLQAWDDSTKFPYEVERRSISVDDVQAARQSDDALPVISGERRVHLNEVRATCVRELGEFYRMVGTDPRLKGPDMLTISQIPELVQQVGKVRDAVAEFITTAEGYWPAYTQIDGAPAEPAEGELFGVEPLAEWERELLGDPVDPRREVASVIAKVSAHHPGRDTYEKRSAEDVNELVASPKPSDYLFEEVVSWLRTYVEPGYPVIFKGKAAHYITVHMVVYLQRSQYAADLFDLQENELADGASVLTHVGEDEAVKVTVTEGPNCIALSFDRCTRRGNTWEPRGVIAKNKEQVFDLFVGDVRSLKEPVQYFVAGSDNKTRRPLVDGRELLATSLTPADILYIARQRGVNMPKMVVEKALPGQRGLLVRTNLTK
jgi:hypothetical protein